jgi:hypothetical protein
MPVYQRKIKKNDEYSVSRILSDNEISPDRRKRGENNHAILRRLPVPCSGWIQVQLPFLRKIIRKYHSLINYECFMVMLACLIIFVHMIRVNITIVKSTSNKTNIIPQTLRTLTRNTTNSKNLSLKIQSFNNLKVTFHKAPKPTIQSPNTNYGGIHINFLAESWERKIYYDHNEAMSGHVYNVSDFEEHWKNFDNYYAFDDDFVRSKPFGKDNHCRRVSWHRLYNPSCNTMHETEVVSLERSSNRLLG